MWKETTVGFAFTVSRYIYYIEEITVIIIYDNIFASGDIYIVHIMNPNKDKPTKLFGSDVDILKLKIFNNRKRAWLGYNRVFRELEERRFFLEKV